MIGRDDIEPLSRPFASLANFRRALALLWRQATDRLRHRRGTRLLMGNALVARLFYSLRRRKRAGLAERVVAGADHRPRPRHRRDGRRRRRNAAGDGAARRCAGDRRVRRQRRAAQRRMSARRSSMRWPFAGAEGDGMRLARAAGAAVEDDHAQPAFWSPVSETGWLAGGRGAYPHLALDRAKPGLIAVNAAGRRFVDEAVSYHDFVVGMHRSHETVPTIPAWLVCDRAFVERYGLGRVPPGRRSLRPLHRQRLSGRGRHARCARCQDQGRCGGPARQRRAQQPLRRDRRRRGLRQGLDRLRPPQRRSRTTSRTPASARSRAAVLRDGGLSQHARIERRACAPMPTAACCRRDGAPIPGLYACGNDMASIMRGHYPGPGITLGPGMVFAYRAAMALKADNLGSSCDEPEIHQGFQYFRIAGRNGHRCHAFALLTTCQRGAKQCARSF